MLAFLKQNFVLLSIPKTGTTAYERALAPHADMIVSNPPGLKHTPLYRYNRWFRPMFAKVCDKDPELVAVVREPISWLGSWYRYRQRPYLDGKPASTKDMGFDAFVRDYCRGKPPPHANVGSQARFLKPHRDCVVSHVFRYEALHELDAFLADRLGFKVVTERANVSPMKELTLSPNVEEILRRKRPEEFELYNSLG